MHLWKVWKSFQFGETSVVTKEKSIAEVVEVLKNNDYGEPENIEYVKKVLA